MSFSGRATRPRSCSVIKSSKVEIRLGNRVLDTVPELSIFGEMALIDRSPRSATALALTDVTLVPVDDNIISMDSPMEQNSFP